MSYVLTCPNCGPREVTDFGFGGEVNPRPTARPRLSASWAPTTTSGATSPACSASGGSTAPAAARGSCAERDTRTNEVLLTELP